MRRDEDDIGRDHVVDDEPRRASKKKKKMLKPIRKLAKKVRFKKRHSTEEEVEERHHHLEEVQRDVRESQRQLFPSWSNLNQIPTDDPRHQELQALPTELFPSGSLTAWSTIEPADTVGGGSFRRRSVAPLPLSPFGVKALTPSMEWSDEDDERINPGLEYEKADADSSDSLDRRLYHLEPPDHPSGAHRKEPIDEPPLPVSHYFFWLCLLIVVGTTREVFLKLQTIPMRNYPLTLNLLNNFSKLILALLLYGAAKFNSLPPSLGRGARNRQQCDFWVPRSSLFPILTVGFFDSMAGLMQTSSITYLPGNVIVLLAQASVVTSTVFSRMLFKKKFGSYYVLGSLVIICIGIVLIFVGFAVNTDDLCNAYDTDESCSLCREQTHLEGCLDKKDTCYWSSSDSSQRKTHLISSGVLALSTIPGMISMVQVGSFSDAETYLDIVVHLTWAAVCQCFFSVILSIPAGLALSPQVNPSDFGENLLNGFRCYVGTETISSGCHPDDQCSSLSLLLVNLSLFVNIVHDVIIYLIMASGFVLDEISWPAVTIMLPVSYFIFAWEVLPEPVSPEAFGVSSLCLIVAGRIGWRVLPWLGAAGHPSTKQKEETHFREGEVDSEESFDEPLLSADDADERFEEQVGGTKAVDSFRQLITGDDSDDSLDLQELLEGA